jgi:Flp pilus assembly protein TadG
MTPRSPKRLRNSRGQSLVEFSLSSIALVLVGVFGVFEMSRMLLVFTTVANAARAGSRYAIVHGADSPATTAEIQTVVQNYLSAAPMNTGSAVIAVTGAGGAKGSIASVKVTYPYDPWVGYYIKYLSINISSTSEGVITW